MKKINKKIDYFMGYCVKNSQMITGGGDDPGGGKGKPKPPPPPPDDDDNKPKPIIKL